MYLIALFVLADGGYSNWSSWTICSASCGGGRHERSRSCTSPPPSPGGKDCSQLGPEKETAECNTNGCPGIIKNYSTKLPSDFYGKNEDVFLI